MTAVRTLAVLVQERAIQLSFGVIVGVDVIERKGNSDCAETDQPNG
jgi:hypothetical protein